MSEYILFKDQKPTPGIEIKYIDSNGNHGYTYLCTRCQNCWRCTISGGELMIEVVKWKYSGNMEA